MERYKPKKLKNSVKAIREMCFECMGGRRVDGVRTLIAECASPDCAVFDFRFGKNPFHTHNLSDEQRKAISDRARESYKRNGGIQKPSQKLI